MRDNKQDKIWQMCFGIIYFIVIASLTTNVIIQKRKIDNNAKNAIITPINKNSHNIKEENHNKVDY